MTVHKDEQLRKRVDLIAKDAAEQVAVGVVMVPDKVDRQGDFARDDTIASFAEQFAALEETGDAGGGIMHAVWPDEWIDLESNRVLDEATTIGGETVEAGAWIQEWHFGDDDLWRLVEDDILGAYSIGAVDVKWSAPMSAEELPDDVTVAEDYPDDGPFWELRSGIVREVSAVDIPAVPDALIHETKADDTAKRLADHLGNRDAFIDEAQDRGHTEDAAERLWELLNRASEVDGSGSPGKQSMLARAGKAFLDTMFPSSESDKSASNDAPESNDAVKEGRTLSRANRDALFASIDAQLDVLEDAGVDHGATRFTDRDDIDFDIAEFGKAASSDEPTDKDAPGGDTPDDTITMSNNDPLADAPEWAKAMHTDIEENSKQINDLADKVAGDGDPDDPEKAWEDAPEWAKQLREEQKDNREQIDDLATAAGKSQQLEASNGPAEEGGTSKANILGLPGGDA